MTKQRKYYKLKQYTENEQEVLNQLDNEGFYSFPRVEGDIDNPIIMEKARLLTLLAFSRILEVEWLPDINGYIYHRCHLLNAMDMKVSDAFEKVSPDIIAQIEYDMDNPEPQENKGETDVLDLTIVDDSDEEYDEYFEKILNEVVTELDQNEAMTLSAVYDEDDADWPEKMNILTQLVMDGRISVDFCPEHLAFHYEIGERHCDIHPEHNGKSYEEIKNDDDDLLESQIIH